MMNSNVLVSLLKIKNLPGNVFAAVMSDFEAHSREVEEREDGVVYDFDYYSYTDNKSCGFIKNYKIYNDNTYSTTIVGEYHCETDENINLYA